MRTSTEFWAAVERELDQRRDPLACEHVRAWLPGHAEDAAALRELVVALDGLAQTELPLRAAPRRRLALPAAAALLLALGAGAFLFLRGAPDAPAAAPTLAETLERQPIVPRPELGRVHAWNATSSLETAACTRAVRTNEGHVAFETEFHTGSASAPDVLAQAVVLGTHSESWSPR